MEDVNEQRRNFISLSELEYGPLKFSFRRVRLQSKWVGIIAIKTELKINIKLEIALFKL